MHKEVVDLEWKQVGGKLLCLFGRSVRTNADKPTNPDVPIDSISQDGHLM